MRVRGIIVEYNPMHNGHIYHLEQAKKDCDVLVCILGGNYTMRGEPAPFDKFFKTELALKYGVDLVVELPTYYTIQNADIFAYASVYLLNQLKVDEMIFGSETNDLDYINKLYELSITETFNNQVKKYLDEGYSYPKANALAFNEFGLDEPKSGDILNLCYIKAINKLNSKIKPIAIKRNLNFNSASHIREYGCNNDTPLEVSLFYQAHGFNDFKRYYDYLRFLISRGNLIKDEGLENKLIEPNSSISTLIDSLVSKRYTKSRINRYLLKNLLDFKEGLDANPPYIRVLGMNQKGQGYLSKIKNDINIISKVKENINPILDFEIKASAIYSLKYFKDVKKMEFLKPIII